jgi:DNA-binding transcriptional LysR family regulator
VSFAEAMEYHIVGLDVRSAWNALLTEKAALLVRPLRIRCRLASIDAVLRMIQAKLGISLAPRAMLGAFTSGAGLLAADLDEDWAEREFWAARAWSEHDAVSRASP